jgi:hypothetical protein
LNAPSQPSRGDRRFVWLNAQQALLPFSQPPVRRPCLRGGRLRSSLLTSTFWPLMTLPQKSCRRSRGGYAGTGTGQDGLGAESETGDHPSRSVGRSNSAVSTRGMVSLVRARRGVAQAGRVNSVVEASTSSFARGAAGSGSLWSCKVANGTLPVKP